MSDLHSRLFNHRKDFNDGGLSAADLQDDPRLQFEAWVQEALDAQVAEPYAFCLSTITADGGPSARIVYLREILAEGLVFYTNYQSDKGQEIAACPLACYTFFWNELHRQVRVRGSLEQVDAEMSDTYFASRPRASQLGAWASAQSAELSDRDELVDRLAALEEEYAGREVPRPPHWGGYILRPTHWEFWKGRSSRLHDRFRYERSDEGWTRVRLNP